VGTVSQVDGHFELHYLPYGNVYLAISMIGFEDMNTSFELDSDFYDLGKIMMTMDTIKIEQINVDAHHELQPKNFSSTIYIAGNKYHRNLKSSLALTIEEESGLAIRSMGQGTTQPVLRGYSGDRFLLTEDGITAGDLSNTSIDHTISMDMASYNKVRVIRGPEALLYGSNTIGGVINVSRQIDSEARFNKSHIQAIVGTESANSSVFGNVVYFQPINNKNQLRFSLLRRNTGDQTSPKGTLNNTALSNSELTGSYTHFGTDFRSTLSYEQLIMDYGIPGSPEGHISGVDIAMNKNTQKFFFHRDISFLGFQTLDIDQRYINYGHIESEKGSSNPSVTMDQQIFSIQSTFKRPQMYIGSLFQHRDFQAGGFYWTPDTKESKAAFFGLIEREIYDFTLQFSSRAEYLLVSPDIQYRPSNLESSQIVERNFSLLSMGLGAFRNWKNWKLSFGTMLTGRSPGIEDLFSDGPHLGTYAYEIGQPTLDQERTVGLEASLDYHTEKSEIRLTGYHNYSPNYHISAKMGDCPESKNWDPTLGISHPCAGSDFIEWGGGSSGWLYKYQMEGLKVSIYGLESELKYNLTNSINIYGSISTLRGENLSDNIPLAYMPPDKYLFTTELDLNPASARITLKKVSPQERLGEFETITEGYFLADVSGSYMINSSNIIHNFIFRVDNIFDQEYYNHLSRIKMIMPEKGRSISIQYRVVL
jgi:iron complex outermembrane receptor protein